MARAADTPEAWLAIAVANREPLDYIKELMQLYREWKAYVAKQQFNEAFAAFQRDCPIIYKTGKASYEWKNKEGVTEYAYDELGAILKVIGPALANNGLTREWNHDDVGVEIGVSCTISHKGGHSRTGNMLKSPPDNSGQKDAIKAKSSTISYLERITLKAALGLASIGEDDDGAGSAKYQPKPFEQDLPPIPADDEFNLLLVSISKGRVSREQVGEMYTLTDEYSRAVDIAFKKLEGDDK